MKAQLKDLVMGINGYPDRKPPGVSQSDVNYFQGQESLFRASVMLHESIKLGKDPCGPKNYPMSYWLERNFIGCVGEAAASFIFNLHSAFNLNTFGKAPDIGRSDMFGLQIRAREDPARGLIVRVCDADDAIFVCVTPALGVPGRWEARGWLYGHEAKKKGKFDDKGERGSPAFFVDQHDKGVFLLNHISDLFAMVNAAKDKFFIERQRDHFDVTHDYWPGPEEVRPCFTWHS